MIKIFVLSSGRTGTKFLSELFKNNVKNCIAKHEPFFDMFGKPIYWYQEGNFEKIRKRFTWKKRIIDLYRTDVFIETNNAFLKSYADAAMEFFPDMKLIHLMRNPLEVTKSQFNRPFHIQMKYPNFIFKYLHTYRGGDGNLYLKWMLTGKEKIFQETNIELSKYQMLLVQWIEIENRAMNFLNKYKKYNDCYILHTPQDFKNKKKLLDMFDFLEIKIKKDNLDLSGETNKAQTKTVVSSNDIAELKKLVQCMPKKYLTIFEQEPYNKFEWASLLIKE